MHGIVSFGLNIIRRAPSASSCTGRQEVCDMQSVYVHDKLQHKIEVEYVPHVLYVLNEYY